MTYSGRKWALRWNHGEKSLVAGAMCDPILFDSREYARNYRWRYEGDPIPMPSVVRVQVEVTVVE